MLAVVVLTRRRLRVQLSDHGLDLAEATLKLWGTLALVVADAVHASSSILITEKECTQLHM